jgi:hypothetical protein
MRQRDQRLTANTTGRVVSQELQRNKVDLTQKNAGDHTNKEHSLGRLKRTVAIKNQEKKKTTTKETNKQLHSPNNYENNSIHWKLAGRNKTPTGTSQGTQKQKPP